MDTKKPVLDLILNDEATTLNGFFGISEERSHDIIDWIRESTGKTGNVKDDLKLIFNQFEKPEELAYSLYLLRPIEEEAAERSDMPGLGDAV